MCEDHAVTIPRLYAIADMGVLDAQGITLRAFAEELAEAGVRLVQLRYKGGQPRSILRAAAVLTGVFGGSACRLILNDRADLAVLAGWDGVHVGQGDLAVGDARRIVGARRWVGVSTHTAEQVRATGETTSQQGDAEYQGSSWLANAGADYVAIGPVFATGTKLDAAPAVGLQGVSSARVLTTKPLVAIGGITMANARSVIEAGADSVAMIAGLMPPDDGRPLRPPLADFIASLAD